MMDIGIHGEHTGRLNISINEKYIILDSFYKNECYYIDSNTQLLDFNLKSGEVDSIHIEVNSLFVIRFQLNCKRLNSFVLINKAVDIVLIKLSNGFVNRIHHHSVGLAIKQFVLVSINSEYVNIESRILHIYECEIKILHNIINSNIIVFESEIELCNRNTNMNIANLVTNHLSHTCKIEDMEYTNNMMNYFIQELI